MISPYDGLEESEWKSKTSELVKEHPLDQKEIKKVVLDCWKCILNTAIGDYKIGRDIFQKPQIIGLFLHELICLEISKMDPETWGCEKKPSDKDIVNLKNARYSIEVKTSSHKSKIFGNRSYAKAAGKSKKSKSGYYLAINFEKFKPGGDEPRVLKIRFGWIDHEDWSGQAAESGQQANLPVSVERYKLVEIQ